MNKILFFMFVFVIMMSNVLALGVTPGKRTLDYEAGSVKKVDFSVFNSDYENVKLVIVVKGELANSITLSEDEFEMSASEESKDLFYTLTMPGGLEPGPHTAEIVVSKLSGDEGSGAAFIGSIVGVESQLEVFVPFPGKFVDVKFNILEEEGNIKFVVPIINKGQDNLEDISARIDVYSSLNNIVETLEEDVGALIVDQREEVVFDWDVSMVDSGKYLALVTVDFDGEEEKIQKELIVGKLGLELIGIGVHDFTLGQVAKFEMIVESGLEKTTDTFAEMSIYSEHGTLIDELKSQNYDIVPGRKNSMEMFWDTKNIEKGIYDTTLFLNYGDVVDEKDFKMKVSDNEIEIIGLGYVISSEETTGGGSLITILVVVIVILVLANLSWFLYFRKKLGKRKR
jgi:hypothetical protein